MEPREFRIGDRVLRRVNPRSSSTANEWGDVVGVNLTINGKPDEKVCVGWADGSRSWELPIELRLASEV